MRNNNLISNKSHEGPRTSQDNWSYDSYDTAPLLEDLPGTDYEDSETFLLRAMRGSYVDTYSLHSVPSADTEANPVGVREEVSLEEALRAGRVVKVAPRLSEQLTGDRRDNIVTYIGRQVCALFVNTSEDEYREYREQLTESEALYQLDSFLGQIEALNSEHAEKAAALRENLTFIGEREYKEAAAGIAAHWKAALESNKHLQIYAVTGEIAKAEEDYKDQMESEDYLLKSDDYLLDNVLANFTEEDWAKYEGRVIVDEADITATQPEYLKVVLLDDWTISGSQLGGAYTSFVSRYPEMKESVEIQLIAANEERVKYGLKTTNNANYTEEYIPVKSYFLAHDSERADYGAHITGFHSSVDYDFENTIAGMVFDGRSRGEAIAMPPMTNIVRPYRADGFTIDDMVHIGRARQGADRARRRGAYA